MPPELWFGEPGQHGKPIELIFQEQIRARIFANRRAIRDIVKFLTIQYWHDECFFCRERVSENWTWEHFVPKSHGADDSGWNVAPDISNCVPSCKACNNDRKSEDAWVYLRRLGKHSEAEIASKAERLTDWQRIFGNKPAEVSQDLVVSASKLLDQTGVYGSAYEKYGWRPSELISSDKTHNMEDLA
ncbi:MAG: HNH endonuclease [Phycisphaeraceae bacterium]|nr:HNH endonuclease [Phycisphaeraceae bacterium]